MFNTYTKIVDHLTERGFKFQLQILDNEASTSLNNKIINNDIAYQLVPPDTHQRNESERAVQTHTNHFIIELCSVDPKLPLQVLDLIVAHAEIALNLLRKSRFYQNFSAYAHLNGQYNYNSTPMAPPGTRIVSHDKPDIRPSWAPHDQPGWYLRPAI